MNFRTDMAVERRDIYRKAKNKDEIPGISVKEEFYDECNVTHVKVENKDGSDAIGKEIGDYITIDLKRIKNLRENEEVFIVKKTSEYLKYLFSIRLFFLITLVLFSITSPFSFIIFIPASINACLKLP